jgi:hypothetical protein
MSPANESYVERADQAGVPPRHYASDSTPVHGLSIVGSSLGNGCMVTSVP